MQRNNVGIVGCAQGQIFYGSTAVYFPTVKRIPCFYRIGYRRIRPVNVRCRHRRKSCIFHARIVDGIRVCVPYYRKTVIRPAYGIQPICLVINVPVIIFPAAVRIPRSARNVCRSDVQIDSGVRAVVYIVRGAVCRIVRKITAV